MFVDNVLMFCDVLNKYIKYQTNNGNVYKGLS